MENIPDMNTLMRLAQSPAGQQLLSLLQRSGGDTLNTAAAQFQSGNYDGAKKALSSLLSDPKAQALLKALEEQK